MPSVSKAEQLRITDFLDRAAKLGTDDEARVKMFAMSELSYIHNRKKANGERYSDLTNRGVIIAYRSGIVERFGDESVLLKYLHSSIARSTEYEAGQQEKREAKHRTQRPIDPEEYVEKAMLMLGHSLEMRWSNPEAMAALCALTGRRPVEVALTGTFTPDPASRQQVIFGGQAKRRLAEGEENTPYLIPLLADRGFILDGISTLRENIDTDIDARQFNSKYAKEIGIQSKRNFQDCNGNELIPSDLRDAYATIAYWEFGPDNVSEIQYQSDILGHKFLATTLEYIQFYIQTN